MNRPGRNGGTLRSFEKGQSGNPAGRPSGRGTISQIMNELGNFSQLELSLKVTDPLGQVSHHQLSYSVDGENTVFAVLAIQILYRALRGDINALKVLLDRTEGRVPRSMKGMATSPDPVIDKPPARTALQLRAELAQVRALIAEQSTATLVELVEQ